MNVLRQRSASDPNSESSSLAPYTSRPLEFVFRSDKEGGAFNRGATERLYTAGAGVGLHCPQDAGRIISPRGRQVAHASSVSFPTQSTPPPEDAKDFGGADVICAYSRLAEPCAQKS
ncbi:hypothetical protein R6Z07F_015053 [Ovis aries]